MGQRTADGQHVVGGVDVEGAAELGKGDGAVVLPLEALRGVRRRLLAAIPGEDLLPLRHSTAVHITHCLGMRHPRDRFIPSEQSNLVTSFSPDSATRVSAANHRRS